jgi:hypothetical protein
VLHTASRGPSHGHRKPTTQHVVPPSGTDSLSLRVTLEAPVQVHNWIRRHLWLCAVSGIQKNHKHNVAKLFASALLTAALTRHHQATSKQALHSASCPKGGPTKSASTRGGTPTHGNSAAVCQLRTVCAPDTRMHQPKTATGVLAAANTVYITRKQSNSNGRAPASHTTDCLSSTWTAPPLHAAATTTMPSATPPPRPTQLGMSLRWPAW